MKRLLHLALVFFCTISFSLAQPGRIDQTFGGRGFVTADLGSDYKYPIFTRKVLSQADGSIFIIIVTSNITVIAKRNPNGSADLAYGVNGISERGSLDACDALLQPDGKMIVAGTFNGDFGIIRYNTDGKPDKSFGNNGKQVTDFDGTFNEPRALTLQSDGKIIVAGVTTDFNESNPYILTMARYTIDGSLDTTFSGDGRIFDHYPNELDAEVGDVAVQDDGRILLAATSGNRYTAMLIGYTKNGTVDSTFSVGGFLSTDIGAGNKYVAIQRDGRIVLGANSLARFKANGAVDSSFDRDGKQFIGYAISSLLILPAGEIVVSGGKNLSRFNTDGSPDNTLDTDGKLTTGFVISSIAPGKAGNLFVASGMNTNVFDFTVASYQKDGSLETNINAGGNLPREFHARFTVFSNTRIQKDGKVLVGGNTWNGSNSDVVIARYNKNGSLDSTFGVKGIALTPLSIKNDVVKGIEIRSDGKIIVLASFVDTCTNRCNSEFFLLCFTAHGTLDTSFSGDGIMNIDFDATSAVLQNDDKLVIAGSVLINEYEYLYQSFAIARYKTDGNLDSSFGQNGKQITRFFEDQSSNLVDSYASSIAIKKDGKIVVGGIAYTEYYRHVFAQYNADGILEWQYNAFEFAYDECLVAVQDDAKVVVAGRTNYRELNYIRMTRLTGDGKPDASFTSTKYGGDGNSDEVSSIAVQEDGKILLGGSAIYRYGTNGGLDTSFGSKGSRGSIGSLNDMTIAGHNLYTTGAASGFGTVGVLARYLLDDAQPVAPKVSVKTPANNAKFTSGSVVYIDAEASDADGTISKVEFYNGNTLLFTATDTPYSFNWINVLKGAYALTAKATDNSGLATVSDTIHFSVVENHPPVVGIINPAGHRNYVIGEPIVLTADASDPDGTIKSVDFYSDSTLLFTERHSPYSRLWDAVPTGTYHITAVATDNAGLTTTSAMVRITVLHNRPPTVNITSPLEGSTYTAPAAIVLSADATAHGGKIKTVEFYRGTKLIHTETYPPFLWKWENVPAGSYSITAKATDTYGRVKTSSPVKINVTSAGAPVSKNRAFNSVVNDGTNSNLGLWLAPNPAAHMLKLYTTGLQNNTPVIISIVSASGVIVKTIKTKASTQSLELNISMLVSGVYTVKLTTEDKVLTRKFVKL